MHGGREKRELQTLRPGKALDVLVARNVMKCDLEHIGKDNVPDFSHGHFTTSVHLLI